MTIEITTHPEKYGIVGYPVAVIQRERGQVVARHPFENYRAATVAANELRRRFPSRRRVVAEQFGRRAERFGRYAAPRLVSGGKFAVAPIRRKIQTRTAEFRMRQTQKNLAVLQKQRRLQELQLEERELRSELKRLRS